MNTVLVKSVKMNKIQVFILVCNLCNLSWQSQLFKSEIKMNPLTRGYEDITVVIDKNLDSKDCIKILKDIKV